MSATEAATLSSNIDQGAPSDQEGADYLSDISPRHAIWDQRKAAADSVAAVYALAADPEIRKHASYVGGCSEDLVLSEFLDTATGEASLKANSRKCRGRHCPICQNARTCKLRKALERVMPSIQAACPHSAWLLLTLTVRNCEVADLRATLRGMSQAWRRFTACNEFQIVKGWLRGAEVTRGAWIDTRTEREIPKVNFEQVLPQYRRPRDPTTAHPHYHAVLLVPPSYFGKHYVKHARWVELWQKAARLNYAPSVDIQRIKTSTGGLEEAIKAATYSIKPAELADDPAWFHELHRQVAGLRFVAAGGVIKLALAGELGREAEDIAEGEPAGDETGQQLLFRWNRPVKRYRKRKEISSHAD